MIAVPRMTTKKTQPICRPSSKMLPTVARAAPAPAVTRLWMIDVNNDRVVIAVAAAPHVDKADIQEVTNIAESASFVVH